MKIELNNRLSFNDHVDFAKSKRLSKIRLLRRLSYIFDTDILLQLYKMLILPVLDFGDVIYQLISDQCRFVTKLAECSLLDNLKG